MSKVTLIDHMGSDVSVVNAARVSFGKAHTEFRDGDERLIRYLATHNHWTPFGHASLSFHIKAPIFVARQLVKHQVGLVWNEISRRYVDGEPEFYYPDTWRGRPVDKKQGSSDEIIEYIDKERVGNAAVRVCGKAHEEYARMIGAGVTPEQARMILPQNTYTEWYWTGSLIAFARVCNLRCQPDAQKETADVSWEIDTLTKDLLPVTWDALRSSE